MKPRILFLIVLLLGVAILNSAVTEYRSRATGNWNAFGSWDVLDGSWRAAVSGETPTSSTGVITIQSGHAVTITVTVSADQIVIASGGTLSIASGKRLNLVDGSGTDLNVQSGGILSTVSAGNINAQTSGVTISISGTCSDLGVGEVFGLGSFELLSGANLSTKNADGISGMLTLSGTVTLSTGANYTFNGSSDQATLGLPTTVNNLIINNSNGIVTTLQDVLSAETITLTNGALTLGGDTDTNALTLNNKTLNFAGYYLTLNNQAISIGGTAQDITAVNVTEDTATIHDLGAVSSVARTWTTTGSQSGAVNLVFRYPVTSGTNVHVWSRTSSPAGAWVDKGSFVSGANSVTITGVTAFDNLDWTISEDETLPIELSSFTVTQTSDLFVQLHWITQSETGVSGFYVFRNTTLDLPTAAIVSPFIPATNTSSETTYSYVDTEVAPGTWYYWLQNVDMDGDNTFHGPISIVINDGSGNPPPVIPTLTLLDRIYPNPFNPLATISYGLAKTENVTIQVYNIKGQPVRTLVSGAQTGGTYRLFWNGTNDSGRSLSSGVYYIKMTAGKYTTTQKAILMK